MAQLNSFDFEEADIDAWDTAYAYTKTGTPTLSTTQKHGGAKAFSMADTAGYTAHYVKRSAGFNKVELYGSVWIWVTSSPGDGYKTIVFCYHIASGQSMELCLNTARTLLLRSASTSRVSTTTAIALNTWTQIKWHWKFAGVSSINEVIIGAETKTDTTNLTTGNMNDFYIGNDGNGNIATYYLDDMVLNDSEYPVDAVAPVGGTLGSFRTTGLYQTIGLKSIRIGA